jgi:hypothetical protein
MHHTLYGEVMNLKSKRSACGANELATAPMQSL